jgi:SSS family solute:Na+ symporter
MTIRASGDRLFPYFISHYLPTGLAGLAVIAVMAAAMESTAAGINSISAVVMSDFVDRMQPPPPKQTRVRLSRWLTVLVGASVIVLSVLMKRVPGNFMEMTNKTANLATMPIFGLFFLAFFVSSATPLAAWLGAAYGLAAAILIGFWDVLTGNPGFSFQLVSPGSIAAGLAVSCALSRWGPRRGAPGTRRVAWIGALLLAGGTAGLIVWGRSR